MVNHRRDEQPPDQQTAKLLRDGLGLLVKRQ